MPLTHVLQLIDGLNVGGAEVLLRDLADGLQRSGYRVSVCYSTPGPLVSDIAALNVPMTRLPRLARIDPVLLLNMIRVMRRERPQIVHTHLFKSDFHGRLAARLSNVPVVVSTLHNTHAWAKNPVLGKLYGASARFADTLIAVSDEVRTFAINHQYAAPEKIVSIANGVNMQRFEGHDSAGQQVRRELGIALDVPLIGVVARLSPQKDHETFLLAASKIAKVLPEARFLIAGDGALRETLIASARNLGLQQQVIFCGIRSDIPAVLSAIDLLVFSSRWEGLPVALLEGMATARPVVATAVGGVPGVVVHGSTGLLVPPGEPETLAEACVQVLSDPIRASQMGKAGRARVEAHYSMDAMIRQTIAVYESLLEQQGLGSTRQHAASI